MINQQLIEYIKQSKAQGVSDEQIKTTLKEKGWQDKDINKAFFQILTPQETEKSKKKLLIPIIIIIGILLIGGGIFAYFQFFEKESVKQLEDTGADEIITEKETEMKELSAIEICEKIEEESNKNSCLARVNKDISFCEKMTRNKSLCINDVIRDIAIQKGNIEDCDKNSGCYIGVAVTTQNSELCKNIESEFLFNECLIGVAVFGENINFCQNIENDYYKKKCEIIIKKDSSLCSDLNQKTTDSPRCKGAIAILTNNPSLCADIEILGPEFCYRAIAVKTKDASICENFDKSDYNYFNCMAMVNKEVSFCESLDNKDMYYKDYCLDQLALSLSELQIYFSTFHFVSLLSQ